MQLHADTCVINFGRKHLYLHATFYDTVDVFCASCVKKLSPTIYSEHADTAPHHHCSMSYKFKNLFLYLNELASPSISAESM